MKNNKESYTDTTAKGEKPNTPIVESVGKKIRLLRQILKISQSDLAESIGVTFQQVQKYESGKNQVSINKLNQISKTLNIDISTFFEETKFFKSIYNMHSAPDEGKASEDLSKDIEDKDDFNTQAKQENNATKATPTSMSALDSSSNDIDIFAFSHIAEEPKLSEMSKKHDSSKESEQHKVIEESLRLLESSQSSLEMEALILFRKVKSAHTQTAIINLLKCIIHQNSNFQ